MDATIQPSTRPLQGSLTPPPDKAVAQRAVLLAGLAEGTTTISPWPQALDCERAAGVMAGLGVRMNRSADGLQVVGRGAQGLQPPRQPLACGESGTTLRLAAGLLAGWPFEARLEADAALRRRPMRRIAEPLRRMGASVEGAAGEEGEVLPPLAIRGRRPLQAITYTPDPPSAQVKSAILLAGLAAGGPTTVVERIPTRDHTERLLRQFGAVLRTGPGHTIVMTPGPLRAPGRVMIPGDISGAAFWVAAALLVPGSRITLRGVGLNPGRVGFLRVLERMGARLAIRQDGGGEEPQGTVEVEAQPLHGAVVSREEVPSLIDELPILMVVATQAVGASRLEGIAELRVKETDRIRSMTEALRRMGASLTLEGAQTLAIQPARLAGAEVASAGDHRTAMSLAIAALCARGPTRVAGAECVAKSYPRFFDDLRTLGAAATGLAR